MRDVRVGSVCLSAMRCGLAAIALTAAAGRASAQTVAAPRTAIGRRTQSLRISSDNVRLNRYLHELAGPGALISVVGGGVISQLRHQSGGPDGLPGQIAERATQRGG